MKKEFYYNELSEEIANYLLENLSMGIKEDQFQFDWPYEDIKLYNNERYINFYQEIERIPASLWQGNDIFASAGIDMCDLPSIEFNFKYLERKWIKNHDYKFSNIISVIAHELHHLTQEIKEDTFQLQNTAYHYFTNPYETEAFYIGFLAESNYSNMTIEQCMENYLNHFVKSESITKKEMKKILVKWNTAGVKLLKGVNNES